MRWGRKGCRSRKDSRNDMASRLHHTEVFLIAMNLDMEKVVFTTAGTCGIDKSNEEEWDNVMAQLVQLGSTPCYAIED